MKKQQKNLTMLTLIAISLTFTAALSTAGAQWTAYNDCVYDPALEGTATDPQGQSIHYTSPNVTYWDIGQGNSGHLHASTGELIDYATGGGTGVTVTITESGGPHWQPFTFGTGGYDPAFGTDASDTFNGIVDMTGTLGYGSTPGWWVEYEFSGLVPGEYYTFAGSACRNGSSGGDYPSRTTIFTISGADTFTNASTPGVTENSPDSVQFVTGTNFTEGYVARWTGITVADGIFKIRAEAAPSSPGSGRKAYALDVFMLETALDCNNNGIHDPNDIAAGTSLDVNSNGVPDECEPDCNNNGVPDAYDISQGTSQDVDGNGIPDECEPDCNGNSIPDAYDISQGTSQDVNNDGIPDECQLLPADMAGSLSHWGRNDSGQANLSPGNNFIAVEGGFLHSIALKADGAIVGWGFNLWGQADPPSENDFVAITAGDDHCLALKSDGSIVGWGRNDRGQADPPTGNDFVAIAAGGEHSLAIKDDGSIVGWGRSNYGQTSSPGGYDYVAIAAGAAFNLALKVDGSIVQWGQSLPAPPSANDFVAIAAGSEHGLALRSDGTIAGLGQKPIGAS